MSQRLKVRKTYKLFIDGKFPRSESGRSFQLTLQSGEVVNVSRASRKDLREAVVAARKAFLGWKESAPILKGQILYRLAEMMESRSDELVNRIRECTGWTPAKAQKEVSDAIDQTVWLAGWADKWQAVLGTINPVAGPYFNISYHEPMGVVGVIAPAQSPLLGLVTAVLSGVVSGNTAVALAPQAYSAVTVVWCEMLATSDFPAGVVNVLTGYRGELLEHFYTHMDINGVSHPDRQQDLTPDQLQKLLSPDTYNLKRFIGSGVAEKLGPLDISQFTEVKTVWHPSSLP